MVFSHFVEATHARLLRWPHCDIVLLHPPLGYYRGAGLIAIIIQKIDYEIPELFCHLFN